MRLPKRGAAFSQTCILSERDRVILHAMASIDTATGEAAHPDISTVRVRSIFASIANRYELFNACSSFGAYKGWIQKVCEVADIEPTDVVLDIAGGTGDVSFAVAEKFHPHRVVCTDLVPEMLDVARKHVKEGRGENTPIEFQVADGQDLPFEADSFDAVTMAYGLRNMPERERALSEVLRVLKPGGSFTCLDFSTPSHPAWRAAYKLYLKNAIPLWGKVITGSSKGFRYLANSIEAYPDQAGVAALMEEAGFADVAWFDCTGGIACVHVATKPL